MVAGVTVLLEESWRASAKLLLVAEAKNEEIEDTMRLLEPKRLSGSDADPTGGNESCPA